MRLARRNPPGIKPTAIRIRRAATFPSTWFENRAAFTAKD
jgi:hypothetical protein